VQARAKRSDYNQAMHIRPFISVAVALSSWFWLSACQTQPAAEAQETPAEKGRQLVADHLNLALEATTLVSSTAVEFSDSSLGCPQPGMAYAQVITPGHRVIVEADGRRFDVRVAGSHARICHSPRRGSPGSNVQPPVKETESVR
jgi:hypothetical protein